MLSRRADVTALIWTQTSFIPCNAVTPLACAQDHLLMMKNQMLVELVKNVEQYNDSN